MMEFDPNYWGILVVPVGVVVCFGAALFVWLRKEISGDPADSEEN